MTTSQQTTNIMTKDFLMTNVLIDCYMFEYIEQIRTKEIFEGNEVYTYLKPVKRKDIVKIVDDEYEHHDIIEDANNLGNKFQFLFRNEMTQETSTDEIKLYRELVVIDTNDDAPMTIPDGLGRIDALVQYSDIIPISLYKIEL
mmetsp:Transcript_67066/g.108749  ORF Transcript_67066/g.108749 Transcript_67066/m.108749 type:complete len:143 (-) Transcript_67066:124-552(-)